MDQRILDKIKKCLALAQSPEPHEAAAAMRQAQKLMDMHGVTQGQLTASDVASARVDSVCAVSVVNKWELHLMHMVANAFGCKIMWTGSSSYNHNVFGFFTLIGLKQQAELAAYTAQVLQRRIYKKRAEYQRGLGGDRKQRTQMADSFAIGWITAVKKTVVAFANPAGIDEAIQQRLNGMTSGKTAKTRERMIDGRAMEAGITAAAGESINRPMSGKASTQLAIGA